MSQSAPEVSIIIPVFHAQETLKTAIASIGTPEIPLEILVSVDDGLNYDFAHSLDPRVIIVDHGRVGSGPGATRNRAIAQARGSYLAYLDGDDHWSPGYLNRLLPLAQDYGCAFGKTEVIQRGQETMVIFPPGTSDRLTLQDVAQWGASFHPVHRADLHQHCRGDYFWELPAQDVMHTVEILLACGTEAPLAADVTYCLNLRAQSVTQAPGFGFKVNQAYGRYEAVLAQTAAAGIFRARAQLNQRFLTEAPPGETFYGFVTRCYRGF